MIGDILKSHINSSHSSVSCTKPIFVEMLFEIPILNGVFVSIGKLLYNPRLVTLKKIKEPSLFSLTFHTSIPKVVPKIGVSFYSSFVSIV